MHSRWLIVLIFAARLYAKSNKNIIEDYFVYKNVPSLVAFSCGDTKHDFQLSKMLNSRGISVAIFKLDIHFEVRKAMTVNYWRLGVLLDMNCEKQNITFVLSESSEHTMFNESYNWLLLGENINEDAQILNDYSFGMNSDLAIAIPSSEGYVLYDVYNHAKGRPDKSKVTKLGSWEENRGLRITLNQGKYQRRANLNGLKLRMVSITKYRPNDTRIEDYLQDYTTRSRDSMSKFAYSIFLLMSDLFNFTMEITETAAWDELEKNGTHTGMFGMLCRNEADFGTIPGVMSTLRTNLARLIGPAWPFRSCFMFRSTSTRIKNEFLRPMSQESWNAITLVAVFATLVLIFAFMLEFVNDWTKRCENAVFVTIGVLCQQGSTFVPTHLAGRIAFLQLLLFSLLIYNYYSASIVSTRLNEPPDKMNDSLNQLAKSSIGIASEEIAYTKFKLKTSPDWEVRTFCEKRWDKLPETKKWMSLDEGFKRVAQGGFAYHTDPNTGYPYIERMFDAQMICELTEVHLYRPQLMALWGRHNSPFTKMAKIGLTKLSETGLRFRQVKRWASRTPQCMREVTSVQSVSLLESAPVLLILFIGIILACGIFLSENIVFKLRNSSRFRELKMGLKTIRKGKGNKNMKKLKNLRMFKMRRDGGRILSSDATFYHYFINNNNKR